MLTPLEIAKVHRFLAYPLVRGFPEPGLGWGGRNQPQTAVMDACTNLIPHAHDLVREFIRRLECIEQQQQAAYANQQVVVAGRTTMSGPQAIAALKQAYIDEQAKLSDMLGVPVYTASSYVQQPGVIEPC